ncbi:MAG: hypothetical protein SF070_01925 [Gemmatimonadota bacterium]|nr:hypothetical protein [Gemmatimonadota bacterium]
MRPTVLVLASLILATSAATGQSSAGEGNEAPWFLVDSTADTPRVLPHGAEDSLAAFLAARASGWTRAPDAVGRPRFSARKVRPNGTLHVIWLGRNFLLTEVGSGLRLWRTETEADMAALFRQLQPDEP